jgi:hypothetical protein
MQAVRALTMYDHVPGGCILHPVTDDDSAPHLRAGEFAIVDTTDTWPPQHGEVYVLRYQRPRWQKPDEEVFYIQQVFARSRTYEGRSFISFEASCLNFEPYVEAVQRTPGLIPEISHRCMAFPVLKEVVIGRIIGVFQAEDKAARALMGGQK